MSKKKAELPIWVINIRQHPYGVDLDEFIIKLMTFITEMEDSYDREFAIRGPIKQRLRDNKEHIIIHCSEAVAMLLCDHNEIISMEHYTG